MKELSIQDIELIVKLIKKQEEKYAKLLAEEEIKLDIGYLKDWYKRHQLKKQLDLVRVNLQKVISNPIDQLSIQDIETTLNILTVRQMNYEDWIKQNWLSEKSNNYFKNLIKDTKKVVKKLTNYLNERKNK